jgi:hypothetical protein
VETKEWEHTAHPSDMKLKTAVRPFYPLVQLNTIIYKYVPIYRQSTVICRMIELLTCGHCIPGREVGICMKISEGKKDPENAY